MARLARKECALTVYDNKSRWLRVFGTPVLLAGAADPGRAGEFVFNTSDPLLFNPPTRNQAWYSPNNRNQNTNANYTVGRVEGSLFHDLLNKSGPSSDVDCLAEGG